MQEEEPTIFEQYELNHKQHKLLFYDIFHQKSRLKRALKLFEDKVLSKKGIKLSQKEQEVSTNTNSCIVLGRSGTGKTTTAAIRISVM